MTQIDAELLDYYHNRCIMCGRPAACLHEILPKSKAPAGAWDTPDNKVPLCTACHWKVQGNTPKYSQTLKAKQKKWKEHHAL
jgi:ferredoxin